MRTLWYFAQDFGNERMTACADRTSTYYSISYETYPGEAGGPVFTTHDEATVWIALGELRYARVTPGASAGTVAVRCEPEGDGTRARVTYDLTALSDTADLAGLAREFGARMESWERMIAATL